MRRVVKRNLPDGTIRQVHPFHVSMEGMKTLVLCRDDEDYDAMVKILCVASRRKNVIIIIYAMWLSRKYGEKATLRGMDVKAIWLDSDWYVRNALAYIPRNALDNGSNVNTYRWSGYRAMFNKQETPGKKVSDLTKRERERIMHTGDCLDEVPWLIDEKEELIPDSFCDCQYLEQAFEGDPAFFLKTIGGQNAAEMQNKLIDSPRVMLTDGEFLKLASETSQRWFKAGISEITYERKARLTSYLFRTTRTTVPQLARVMNLPRDTISQIVK